MEILLSCFFVADLSCTVDSPRHSLIGSVLLGAAEQLFSFELFKVDVSGWVVLLQLDG